MAWLKISDDNGGTYGKEASPDPEEIVDLNTLQAEIDDLDDQIDAIDDNVPYPDDATDDQKEAIDKLNTDRSHEKEGLIQERDEKQDLYDYLKDLE